MSKVKDGGPAFPGVAPESNWDHGMSLRDWFAGQSLMGIRAYGHGEPEDVAKLAFEDADAMLAERAKEAK